MSAKLHAHELISKYRMLLMNEGEDLGQEILVSILSKKCALIAIDEIAIMAHHWGVNSVKGYLSQVKTEIENYE